MRHRLLVLAATAALLPLSVAPVQAAVPVVVIGQPPTGWTSIHEDCGNGVASGGEIAPAFGPTVTGTSDGSIRLTAGSSDLEGFEKEFPGPNRFDQLAELAAHISEPSGGRFAWRITVHTDDGPRWLVSEPATAGTGFEAAVVQLNGTPFSVYVANQTGTLLGTTTISGYQADHADDTFAVGVVSWGCVMESTVYVDTLRLVVEGVEYQYDFEPQPTSLIIDSDKATVVSGQPVQLSTVLLDHTPEPLVGNVRLLAAPSHGAAFWVGTTGTDSTGIGALTDNPEYTTVYRWYFEGADIHAPSQSVKLKIPVKSKVTASLVDATVKKGERIKVAGKVTPGWKDLLVTLWRETSTGRIKLGTTRTTSNSTYKVLSDAISTTRSATWKVHVTSAPTEDNTAGKSKVLKVTLN